MSRASTKGSPTVPAGKTIPPSRTPSRNRPSLKFWQNQLALITVQSAPAPRTASSAGRARSSPRADSSAMRRTPLAAAGEARAPSVAAAPESPMSG